MAEKFRIRLQKDSFVFSAGHFITFGAGECERIHGHNYRAIVELCGELDANHYVFDFIELRDAVQRIVATLDHRMLLPAHHPTIHVTVESSEVVVRHEKRRWVFPRDECVILPVANTTTELLAKYVADQLREIASARAWPTFHQLSVSIDENHGQWGIYEWTAEP